MLTDTTAGGAATSLTAPAEAVAITTTLLIEPTAVEGSPLSADQRKVDCFAVKRLEVEASGAASNAAWFTVPLTLSAAYSESAIAGLDEATLTFPVYDVTAEA